MTCTAGARQIEKLCQRDRIALALYLRDRDALADF